MSAPASIAMWSLGTDVALMSSILFFVYRVLRNPTNPRGLRQLGELEGTIRSLIREAEGAGKALNDQLIRRQEALEKLLFDLEACEKRIHRVQSRAEETRGGVDVAMVKVQKALDALNGALTRFQTREFQVRYVAERGVSPEEHPAPHQVHVHSAPPPHLARQHPSQPILSRGNDNSDQWYEAPDGTTGGQNRLAERHPDDDRRALLSQTHREHRETEPRGNDQATFYPNRGQPSPSYAHSESAPESVMTAGSIHDRVTVDHIRQKPRITREHLTKAQALLKQGIAPEEVARQTGLLLDQIHLLTALADGRGESRHQAAGRPILRPATDPRLGVLGNMGRHPS